MTIRQLRRFLLLIIATLLGLGCIAVYSSTAIIAHETTGSSLRFVIHHVLAIVFGLGLSLACLKIPPTALRHSAKWLVLASLILLALVFVFGSEIGGARRWFRIGHLSLQPSEFAQLALVIYLADFLARKRAMVQDFREGFLPPMLVTGLLSSMVLIQPDLGTTVVMVSVAMLLLVVANAKGKHVTGSMLIGALGLVILIAGKEYRRRRILAFLDPWKDPQGVGFQILQSYVAMSDGGLVGRGIGASLQKFFFLPGAHTDFIFAVIGEELGLLGTTALLVLFGLLISCGIRIAQVTDDLFSKYLIFGCVGLIGLEAIVHMAVVTGMLPTKGLPLPLVSYGGTSMVGNLIACALICQGSRSSSQSSTCPTV